MQQAIRRKHMGVAARGFTPSWRAWENMMRYGLDDKPGLGPMLLYGLQWWAVLAPSIIIIGVVVARLHYADAASQTFYMQKLFAVMGVATVVQVLAGHRLPLVVGPAATLLVGIVASTAASVEAIYTAIIAGGALLAVASFSGVLARVRLFFTPRIVATILMLISVTLAPTILRLIFSGQGTPVFQFVFALSMVACLVVCNARLPGIWKSMTVVLGVVGGSCAYFCLQGFPALPVLDPETPRQFFVSGLEFHAGTLLSFVFCFLALTINELGSIEAVGCMLGAPGMDERLRKGAGVQGLANMAAGGLGVVGPVDFSLSAGVIAATGCASRYTLIPAGLGLIACAAFPKAVQLAAAVPGAVMGALMLYLMASQLASGLVIASRDQGVADFSGGMTIGLSLMIGLAVAFAPPHVFAALHEGLGAIVGNGFVMGTLAVIILEHTLTKGKKRP